jgi:anti-sigma factor RsiW
MQQHSDEALVAYLDGELDNAERRHVEAWVDADPAVHDRLAALARTGELVRGAYLNIANEPVPERLIAAARGETKGRRAGSPEAQVVPLRPPRSAVFRLESRWNIGLAAAAGFCGIIIGGLGSYFGSGVLPASPAAEHRLADAAANSIWLDNAAGYYKLTASAGDNLLIDVPATTDANAALQKISQSLPQPVHPPDLKPSWGLTFRGARLVVVEGRPAAELVYLSDNQAMGPLTLVVGTTKLPDVGLTVDRQQDVNLVYWRHHGRAYALAGRVDPPYLWNIANDVAWKLDAI